MSLLESAEARELLADAEVCAADVLACTGNLQAFLERYLPCFYRKEHHELADVVLRGKLSDLQRKTCEPIAYLDDRERKPVQNFVGAGKWDDERVMGELRRHVAEQRGDPDGVLAVDGSGFPKKGTESCGVARQWCGRLGKVDNCQVGVFLTYVTARGYAPIDRRLYLPREWAEDWERREKCHVPEEVCFQEGWRIALDLLDRSAPTLPFAWVVGDDEYGRASAFRAELRLRRYSYVLDVPANTQVRNLDETPAEGARRPPWRSVEEWTRAQPSSRWRRTKLGDGSKCPRVVKILEGRVQTRDDDGRPGTVERLVVIRTVDQEPQTWYTLSNADPAKPTAKLAEVHGRRHGAEELFEAGKGEVGLSHYEVRSWVGWHHHMTLSLLALWFVILEKDRAGKKNPGTHSAANARVVRAPFAPECPNARADRQGNQSSATTQRRGPHLPLSRGDQQTPATAPTAGRLKRLQ
jgi:SRSO17 transposase